MRSDYVIIAFVLGCVLGWVLHRPSAIHTTSEYRDTVTVIKPREITKLVRVPADTVIRTEHDTVATLDTILHNDTITIDYSYAHQAFSLLYRPKPDSVSTIYVTRTLTTERPWWIDALTHTGAATLGYAIGNIR